MPIYVIDALSHIPGIAGLFCAGIFSGSLSTVSTALNSLSAVTLEDYYKNIYYAIKKKPFNTSQRDSAFASKLLSTFYGFICIGVAFLSQNLGGVLQASLTIFGVVGGPLLAIFTLGMFTKIANQWGVIVGHVIGMSIAMWSQFGFPRPPPPLLSFSTDDCSKFDPNSVGQFSSNQTYVNALSDEQSYFYLYRISYLYAVILGFSITLIVGYLLSFLFYKLGLQSMEKIYVENSMNEIDTTLFVPPIAKRLKRNFEMKQVA